MFAGPGLAQSSALSLALQAHLLHALFVMCGCVSVCTSADHVRQMHDITAFSSTDFTDSTNC